jgi:hypothetical protein
MTRTIVLTGARGGQGTSTVAAALAILAAGHGPTQLVPDDPRSTAALMGVVPVLDKEWVEVCPNLTMATNSHHVVLTGHPATTVIDGGRIPNGPFDEDSIPPVAFDELERYAVLRGPCYVALSSLLVTSRRFDGIIVLAEPGRALSERDVTDVLGIPVVATVPIEPAIARSIDAGLLLSSLHRHSARLRSLDALVRPRSTLSTPPLQPDTDLHLSLGDRNASSPACRARPDSRAVYRVWGHNEGRCGHAEHRAAVPRRGRLLRR